MREARQDHQANGKGRLGRSKGEEQHAHACTCSSNSAAVAGQSSLDCVGSDGTSLREPQMRQRASGKGGEGLPVRREGHHPDRHVGVVAGLERHKGLAWKRRRLEARQARRAEVGALSPDLRKRGWRRAKPSLAHCRPKAPRRAPVLNCKLRGGAAGRRVGVEAAHLLARWRGPARRTTPAVMFTMRRKIVTKS